MGTSTDGQICYGIAFEEEFEFPWDGDYDDIDEWWIYGVHGYKPSFELYDSDGGYLDGREPSKEETSRYYDERRAFAEAHPLPVELVTHCSYDYPMYILAVKGSLISNSRGFPVEIAPSSLSVADADRQALLRFCVDHGIEHDDEPKWLLTSMWG